MVKYKNKGVKQLKTITNSKNNIKKKTKKKTKKQVDLK